MDPAGATVDSTVDTKETLEDNMSSKLIIIGCIRTPIQRPDRDAGGKEACPENEEFTANTNIITNKNGLVLYAGTPRYGGTHHTKTLSQDDPDLGVITDSMKNPNLAPKVTVYAERGYADLEQIYPGINLVCPEKRLPGDNLTMEQMAYNKMVDEAMVMVEYAMSRIREFDLLNKMYDDTLERLGQEIRVITGFVNSDVLRHSKQDLS